MTINKIAISLPRPLLASARRAVREGRASNVSAYVASALEEKSKLDELAELLREMLAETGGPLTAAERRAADAALGVPAAIAKLKLQPQPKMNRAPKLKLKLKLKPKPKPKRKRAR